MLVLKCVVGEEFDYKISLELSDYCGCYDRDQKRTPSYLLIDASFQSEGFDWLINQGGQENLIERRGKFIEVCELLNNGRIL